MRKSILTLVLTAMVGLLSAQTLQFELDGTVFSEGQTIISPYDEDMFEYLQHMQIRNLSNNELNVVVEREIVESADGAMIYFCWGLCMSPEENVSRPVAVPAQTLSTDDLSFHCMFTEGETGVVTVKYYAYDESTPEDRISITILAGETAQVGEGNHYLSQAYPNPATTTVSFNVSYPGTLKAVVYNLLGQEVKSMNFSSVDKVSFPVDDLQAGIYFCSFVADGQPWKTEKFIVKR